MLFIRQSLNSTGRAGTQNPTYISWSHHIIAEVAAKLVSRDVGKKRGAQVGRCYKMAWAQVPGSLLLGFLQAMSHDNKGIKPQGSIDDQLLAVKKKRESGQTHLRPRLSTYGTGYLQIAFFFHVSVTSL